MKNITRTNSNKPERSLQMDNSKIINLDEYQAFFENEIDEIEMEIDTIAGTIEFNMFKHGGIPHYDDAA